MLNYAYIMWELSELGLQYKETSVELGLQCVGTFFLISSVGCR